MDKYNIETFLEFMNTEPTDDAVFRWFAGMNKDYKKLKKEGLVTEDVMLALTDFWNEISDVSDDLVFDILSERWHGKMPVMIEDIKAFIPERNRIICERTLAKLDPYERGETESLFNAIWEKKTRVSGSFSYYDWDKDSFVANSFEMARNKDANAEYLFKSIVGEVIYNRGDMLLRFFSRRGGFEIAAVHVGDGRGNWECLTKTEIQQSYTDEYENPMSFSDNETVIFLDKPEPAEASNILYFKS